MIWDVDDRGSSILYIYICQEILILILFSALASDAQTPGNEVRLCTINILLHSIFFFVLLHRSFVSLHLAHIYNGSGDRKVYFLWRNYNFFLSHFGYSFPSGMCIEFSVWHMNS